jgi:cobyrinic acid a,c-diamide synthase
MSIPGIVIAGTNSGCGKTTISMGIMAALADKGFAVQPYKAGPDFIDPMFHSFITGRECRNLDSWMLEDETVRYLYSNNAATADIAVTEGVMGFYDGIGGDSIKGSTADVSKMIGAPVVLVVNGEAMALSVAALVKGFAEFDKTVVVKGVIFNNIASDTHFKILKAAVENYTGVTVLGYLRPVNEIAIGSRHLGLVTSSEIIDLKEKTGLLSRQIQETVNLELLMKLSKETRDVGVVQAPFRIDIAGKAKIAIAKDEAFCFYYKDSLELLETMGAELAYFSPLRDLKLPEGIDGLYIGGGYPEVWAKELQENLSMKQDIKRHVSMGVPAYAECGGLMYLTDSIVTGEGGEFGMVGLIPGKSRMTSKLKRFGYVTVRLTEDTILGRRHSEIRAHEFHYSETIANPDIKTCYEVSRRFGGIPAQTWNCGFRIHNLIAGYPHMHFWANPSFAREFIQSCCEFRHKRGLKHIRTDRKEQG